MKKTFLFVLLTLLLVACSKNDKDITSRDWEVVSMTPAGSPVVLNAPNSYILNLEKKSFTISLDANNANGDYRIPKKGTIKFGDEVLITEVCCDSDYAKDLLSMLTGMTSYRIENDQLIFSGNGEIVLERK